MIRDMLNNQLENNGRIQRQTVSLGLTTTRGRGSVVLFDGWHVRKYNEQITDPKFIGYASNRYLEVFTTVDEIDIFFNRILDYISRQGKDMLVCVLDKLIEAIESVRNWLQTTNIVVDETRLSAKLAICASKNMSDALNHLLQVCGNPIKAAKALNDIPPVLHIQNVSLLDMNAIKSGSIAEFPYPIESNDIKGLLEQYLQRNNHILGTADTNKSGLIKMLSVIWVFVAAASAWFLYSTWVPFLIYIFFGIVVLLALPHVSKKGGVKGLNQESGEPKSKDDLRLPEYQQFYTMNGRAFIQKISELMYSSESLPNDELDNENAMQVADIARDICVGERRVSVLIAFANILIVSSIILVGVGFMFDRFRVPDADNDCYAEYMSNDTYRCEYYTAEIKDDELLPEE